MGWLTDPFRYQFMQHALVAAVLMPASSLTVVLASWRSRTFVAAPEGDEGR